MLKKSIFIFSCLVCVLLTGCGRSNTAPSAPLAVVTSVDIDYAYRQVHLQRTYTQAEKIDVFLHFLNRLSPLGRTSEDPEQLLGDVCKITVRLTDGTQRIYRMRGSQYLSVDSRPWQLISKERGSVLFHLVNHIPSDLPQNHLSQQRTSSQ